MFEVELTNDLPEETTIHWHGIPVANGMDGVPNIIQEPVEPGDGLQLDRGLLAPLVIEETEPHVEYDREYTVVLDDYLEGEPNHSPTRAQMEAWVPAEWVVDQVEWEAV